MSILQPGGGRGIGQIAAYRPLAACGMEELAARQLALQPSGGVLFARNTDGEQKTAARQQILDLFTPERWPGRLRMLTMPGLQWRFERKLLGMRDVGWIRRSAPGGTIFTGCENDRAIYFAAVAQMPGMHTSTLKRITKYTFAEMAVKTGFAAFFFANIDDLMRSQWDNSGGRSAWDAVWLDYTGPLTVERLQLIEEFYARYVGRILIVTALKARFNENTTRAIARAGGHSNWLRAHLRGEVLHDLEYYDTSPMAQFAVRKTRWWSPLLDDRRPETNQT